MDILDDVNDVTAMILREICRLFQTLQSNQREITLGEEQFRYYFRKFKEKTSSSKALVHVGHYILATFSEV